MTERERQISVLTYRPTDKIPLNPGGPRESTLMRWHKEGLPESVHYMDFICDRLGIIQEPPKHPLQAKFTFTMTPEFEPAVLAHENGHYIARDEKGIVCEISDRFDPSYLRTPKDFVTRRYLEFPVKCREDWEEIKKRYDPDDPSRMPAGLASLSAQQDERDNFFGITVNGPFWQMREWLGLETLCIWFYDEPEIIHEMCDFWKDYIAALLRRFLPFFPPDMLRISEDMAYKEHPMIGPDMAREFLLPVYKAWTEEARKYGVPIVDVDSDGRIDLMIPVWLEGGIHTCDPIERAAGNDIDEFRRLYGKQMSYIGGIDKRAIAAGGKIMETEVRRVVEPFLKEGGLVPTCDHGVPSDISLKNFIDYTGLLARLTGWL